MLVSATRSEVEPHDNEERVRRGLSRAHDLLPPKQNPAGKKTNTARVSRFLISQLFLSGHPARIGYWSWFRNQGACVPSVSTETGLMLKGLNSGRCDWMAALAGLQTPASQDGQVRPEGTWPAGLPRSGHCRSNPTARRSSRGRGCCPASWQPSSPGPDLCSRRSKASPHRENSPVRVTRLGSPLSPTVVSRGWRGFPANCPKQQTPRQKWVMEKGTRQKTWSWKRQPNPGTHAQINHSRRLLTGKPRHLTLTVLCIKHKSTQ